MILLLNLKQKKEDLKVFSVFKSSFTNFVSLNLFY